MLLKKLFYNIRLKRYIDWYKNHIVIYRGYYKSNNKKMQGLVFILFFQSKVRGMSSKLIEIRLIGIEIGLRYNKVQMYKNLSAVYYLCSSALSVFTLFCTI